MHYGKCGSGYGIILSSIRGQTQKTGFNLFGDWLLETCNGVSLAKNLTG